VIRTVVFIDYEDCLVGALRAFRAPKERSPGQELDPRRLAARLMAPYEGTRELADLRVYRSIPNPRRDLVAFGEAIDQIERWSAAGATVIRRKEDGDQPNASAKGLSVALAIDLVVMATRDVFDVGLVCSSDLDLAPALSAVLDQTWKSIEVAAWRVEIGPSSSLRLRGEQPRCHWLDRSIYEEVVVEGG
jgi:hypothetical protein